MGFKVKISVSKECNLCGLCVKYCPANVFEIVNGELVVHEDRCIYCKGCEPLCPQSALRVKLLDEGLSIEIHKSLL